MSLRRIRPDLWRWSGSTRATMLVVHGEDIIHECTWNEFLLTQRLSNSEPVMMGRKDANRRYWLHSGVLYTCPAACDVNDVAERIIFPGNEADLQRIHRMLDDAHRRWMKSAGELQREAERNLQLTQANIAARKRSRYIPNRSKIAASVRTNGICYHCREKPIEHFDHLIPFSKGGSNEPHNIVGSCGPCNWDKSDSMPGEWDGGV